MIKKLLASLAFCLPVLFFCGCCQKQPKPADSEQSTKAESEGNKAALTNNKAANGSLKQKNNKKIEGAAYTGCQYSISQSGGFVKPPSSSFESDYLKGVELIEKSDFAEAIDFFNNLLLQYPNGEEASIIEFCTAETYFRMKDDKKALELFKKIVEKYPNTQAAENAKEGIVYLLNFDKYVENYISPYNALKQSRQDQ